MNEASTPRLSLRRPEYDDLAALLGILSNPVVVQHNPSDQVTNVEDVEARQDPGFDDEGDDGIDWAFTDRA